jgi:hypothetical protein
MGGRLYIWVVLAAWAILISGLIQLWGPDASGDWRPFILTWALPPIAGLALAAAIWWADRGD